jgi:hypothetical protein
VRLRASARNSSVDCRIKRHPAMNPSPRRTLRFGSVEEYLRKLHPEYEFIFSITESAHARLNYTPEDAKRTQTYMVENAFEVAKRSDQDKGLEIIIERFSV